MLWFIPAAPRRRRIGITFTHVDGSKGGAIDPWPGIDASVSKDARVVPPPPARP
jgi:hypothetical protein